MSNRKFQAYEAVNNPATGSKFIFRDNGRTLEVDNAVILWPNFSAKVNRFGVSACTFNLCVTPDVSVQLANAGFRVRSVPVEEVEDEKGKPVNLFFVNIKVNMDSAYPPVVNMFTEYGGKKSRTQLDKDSIAELDRAKIVSADCIINCYASKNYPGKVTGYLRKLNVITQKEVEFGGKYDDWEDEGSADELENAGEVLSDQELNSMLFREGNKK